MKRLAILWTVGLLAACSGMPTPDAGTSAAPPEVATDTKLANGAVCRVGPDGGPVVADRGIGGTGAPVFADRGIGGTGIIGVITGFASICVNGLEVQYDNSALVDINGVAASPAVLRVGQVVAIQAAGPATAPVATSISVRREVAGRIDSVELGSGLLTIAGQQVAVPARTWGAGTIRLGDWVSVSGLRGPTGMLVATRLDAAPAGTFMVNGQVAQEGGVMRVGSLTLDGAAAAAVVSGQTVTVSGRYVSGQPRAITASAGSFGPNPADYFGSAVKHLVVEAFVRVANGTVWLNGLKVNAAPGVGGAANTNGIAIVSLERKPDGRFTAVDVHYTDARAFGTGSAKVSAGMVRGDPSGASQRVRRGGLPSVGPADDADTALPAPAPASSVTSLSNPAGTKGPVSVSQPVSGASGLDGTAPLAASALTGSSVPANAIASPASVPASTSTGSGASVGGARIESVSPSPSTATSGLISSKTPTRNSTTASFGAPSSGVAAHALLVSGSATGTSANLLTTVTAGPVASSASTPRVVVSTPKASVAGTSSGKFSTIGGLRQGGH